jgi:hypothetical protein
MTNKEKKIGRGHFSKLSEHRQKRKVLTPPLLQMPSPIHFHSWVDERLPEALWAILLVGQLPRERYMPILSAVAKAAMDFRGEPNVFPDHSALAGVRPEQFAVIFAKLLADEEARAAVSPLLLPEDLPDRAHWASHLSMPDTEGGWAAMAYAVSISMDLHARTSIDVRWLRIMFLGLQHRLHFSEGQHEVVDMLCAYPEGADVPDWADSMIRAMEPMIGAAS